MSSYFLLLFFILFIYLFFFCSEQIVLKSKALKKMFYDVSVENSAFITNKKKYLHCLKCTITNSMRF